MAHYNCTPPYIKVKDYKWLLHPVQIIILGRCSFYLGQFEMTPSVSVHFISLVTCAGLREEPQTAFPMSFTCAHHIATSMLIGH